MNPTPVPNRFQGKVAIVTGVVILIVALGVMGLANQLLAKGIASP